MKKIYLLFLLAIAFSFNQINAQVICPAGGTIDDGTQIFFLNAPGVDCDDMPLSIIVDEETFILQTPCSGPFSTYDLDPGTAISDPFTVTDGFTNVPCTYTSGVLPIEDFEFLNATFKVFPNPLMKDSQLTVKFATNITAKIYIYDVTGKLAVTDEIDNVNSKQINTSNLTNGVYFLRLVTDNTTITKKVIIMK